MTGHGVRWAGAAIAAATLATLLSVPRSGLPAPIAPTYAEVVAGAYERSLAVPVLPASPAPAALPVPTPSTVPPVPSAPATGLADAAGSRGIPGRVLAAYRRAADLTAAADPGCHLDWSLLAGIGRIESRHASGGRVDAAGTTDGRILGPVLDGSLPGTAVILDTDGGALDGDARFDRATGPMQFLPGTWRGVGADGNGDGVADPNNVDDAALGAARYLCAGGGDLRDRQAVVAALFRYNRSAAYGADVLAWAEAYRTGAAPVPDGTGPVPAPVDDGVARVLAAPPPAVTRITTPRAAGPTLAELLPPAKTPPPAGSGPAGAPASGTPSAGTPSAGTPSAGTPSAGTPSAGTPSAGTPSAGTPSAGTPSAGTPSAGTPSAGTPSAGTPSAGTPSAGTPSGGSPSAGSTPAPASPSPGGLASPGASSAVAPPSQGSGTPSGTTVPAGPPVVTGQPGGTGAAATGTPAGTTAGAVPPTAGSRAGTATAPPAAPAPTSATAPAPAVPKPVAPEPAAPEPAASVPSAPSPPPPPAPACPTAPVTIAASATRTLPDGAGLLLRFALPEVPAGCKVASATLRLDPGTSDPLAVRRVTGTWSAETVAEPASVGPAAAAPAGPGVRRVAVTALMPGLYAAPAGGLLVRGAGAPAGPARLVITFGPR